MSQGGDKTEKATAKKRRDARKEGQVRQSQEVNTTFSLIVMLGLLLFIWPWFIERLMNVYHEHLGTQSIVQASTGLSTEELMNLFVRILLGMLSALFPILGVAMVAGILVHVAQIGFNFTTKPLQMKFSKINPINGFKRMFSTRTLVELAKSILKITLIGYIAYGDYMNLLDGFPHYVGQDPYLAFMQFMNNAFMMALKMCVVMVFIAIADYLYQWWKYEKDLRMTKQEVKDEYKMMEGDPQIKGKIRQKQRQMSAMRMMSRVPEADVVITNPTHYAVALKYDDKESPAPVVTAKGIDYLALKIREVAKENGVEIVENPPLAQSLYAMCEVDDEIPADLYQAVADVLVFVYRQKGKIR
jgi:flagellar biosynthetic protein FlhB